MIDYLGYLYSLLIAGGGVAGYLMSGSVMSLVMGLIFGCLTMLNMTSLFVASILSICKGFKLFFPPHWVIPWVVRLLIQSQGPLELHHRAIWLQEGSGQAPERHQPLWRPWN